ncbi:hypothetical protein F0562_016493 [Nyssa sinensis]|uniref:Uncharacterized protein n=1 Tax=Nyssa sinensis TaxID=561372 RepID=A0A5J4ZIZ5_9ASTE|nr:hypothetical protein F0562_016493 [Nyssa sinensis]
MFQLIQRKGSSQHLMALMKIDGSAEKAWPLNTVCGNGRSIFCRGSEVFIGNPIYGPLQISRAEPVHLQFGHYGISSWLNDIGGSSQTLGADDLSTDGSESGSRYHSSCRSSPRMSDGPTEELGEELLDLGCDEECDNPLDVDTNGNFSDVDDEQIHEEMEGSVDEESADSDEEYDDLAMQDVHEKGFLLDDAEYNVNLPVCGD